MSSTGVAQNSVIDDRQVYAMLKTNTDPTNTTAGLKEGGAWSVSATFGLTPTPYGNYGMELNDGTSSQHAEQDVSLFVLTGAMARPSSS